MIFRLRIAPQAPEYYDGFAIEGHNVFSVSDTTQHAYFRRQVSSLFSRKNVLTFERNLWEHAKALSKQLAVCTSDGTLVGLGLVKMDKCMALGVVSKFQYGDSSNALMKPGFQDEILETIEGFSPSNHFVSNLSLFECLKN
jgi:hypothetical protein